MFDSYMGMLVGCLKKKIDRANAWPDGKKEAKNSSGGDDAHIPWLTTLERSKEGIARSLTLT